MWGRGLGMPLELIACPQALSGEVFLIGKAWCRPSWQSMAFVAVLHILAPQSDWMN